MTKEYTVQAYVDIEHVGRWLEVEQDGFTSLKEAKARAKYYLTTAYQRASESSQRLSYSRIIQNGRCVVDFSE